MVDRAAALGRLLRERIVILDGAMGTAIQGHDLDEADYRSARFAAHGTDLRGNFDILNLTRPDLIGDLHRDYLAAGADIIRTNTFNSTIVSQADYATEAWARDLNREGARIARRAADAAAAAESSRPRFVAGVLGPTNRRASISPDAAGPGLRGIAPDELTRAYGEAAAALLEGGADLIMVETAFDGANVAAALRAVRDLERQHGVRIPVMISGTVPREGGRMLSGQTPEEFWQSVISARPVAVGLNCGFGATALLPQLEELSGHAAAAVSVHPNAGLPNASGGYDDTPQTMAAVLRGFAERGLVNIVGGCCGTTPDFVAAFAEAVRGIPPRAIGSQSYP